MSKKTKHSKAAGSAGSGGKPDKKAKGANPKPTEPKAPSGGGKRGKPEAPKGGAPAPTGGSSAKQKVPWDVAGHRFWVVSKFVSSDGSLFPSGEDEDGNVEDEESRARWWSRMGQDFEGTSARRLFVFKHLMSAAAEHEMSLVTTLLKVITPGRAPRIDPEDDYDGMVDVYYRKNDEKMLEDDTPIYLRYQGLDAVLMGSVKAFWPPPLELVTPTSLVSAGASVCWEVKWEEGSPSRDQFKEILAHLTNTHPDWTGTTFFRKADEKGRPTSTFYLKALNVPVSERINFELGEMGGGGKAACVYAPQCALCLERPVNCQFHDHVQCPLLGTLNKIRAQGDFKPMTFEPGGVLVRSDEKMDLDVSLELRTLMQVVKTLSDRVEKIEQAPQSSAGGSQAHSGGGKRKQSGSGGEPPKYKKKKTEAGSGQGSGGQQGGPSGGKGKGKDKK